MSGSLPVLRSCDRRCVALDAAGIERVSPLADEGLREGHLAECRFPRSVAERLAATGVSPTAELRREVPTSTPGDNRLLPINPSS